MTDITALPEIPLAGNAKRLEGQRFGTLSVLRPVQKGEEGKGVAWLCLCDCGNHRLAYGPQLKAGRSKSCSTTCELRPKAEKKPRAKAETPTFDIPIELIDRMYETGIDVPVGRLTKRQLTQLKNRVKAVEAKRKQAELKQARREAYEFRLAYDPDFKASQMEKAQRAALRREAIADAEARRQRQAELADMLRRTLRAEDSTAAYVSEKGTELTIEEWLTKYRREDVPDIRQLYDLHMAVQWHPAQQDWYHGPYADYMVSRDYSNPPPPPPSLTVKADILAATPRTVRDHVVALLELINQTGDLVLTEDE